MTRLCLVFVLTAALGFPAFSQSIVAGDPLCRFDCLSGFAQCMREEGCQLIDAQTCRDGSRCNDGFCGDTSNRCPQRWQPAGCGIPCYQQNASCVQGCGPRFRIPEATAIIERKLDPELARPLLESIKLATDATRSGLQSAKPDVARALDSYREHVRALSGRKQIDQATADALESLARDVETALSDEALAGCLASPLGAGAIRLRSRAMGAQ